MENALGIKSEKAPLKLCDFIDEAFFDDINLDESMEINGKDNEKLSISSLISEL